jgi:hypothetical protein
MRATPAPRVALAATFEAAAIAVELRLRAGDEGRQAVDAAIIGDHGLRLRRLRLILRLWPVFALTSVLTFTAVLALAPMLARLLVALIGRLVVTLLARAIVAHERLQLLHRNEARLLAEAREVLALVLVLGHEVVLARLLLRLVLAELLLGRRDQAEVVFGVLIVVFSRDRVAGGACVTRKLHIFFRDVRGSATDLDVGSVGFEHPGHRVLATPVIVVVIVIPVTHPLVVLTVSHIVPLIQP